MVAWISGIFTRLCIAFITSVLFCREPATRKTAERKRQRFKRLAQEEIKKIKLPVFPPKRAVMAGGFMSHWNIYGNSNFRWKLWKDMSVLRNVLINCGCPREQPASNNWDPQTMLDGKSSWRPWLGLLGKTEVSSTGLSCTNTLYKLGLLCEKLLDGSQETKKSR